MSSGRPIIGTTSRLFPRVKSIKPWLRLKKWNIVRGDEVMIICGKDKRQIGRVRRVLRDKNSVIVSDLNLVFKHVSRTDQIPTGRIRKEMPIHISNVSLIDPETRQPVKPEFRKEKDPKTGKVENRRYIRGTSMELPKPKYLEYQKAWEDSVLDTLPEEVARISFEPSLAVPPLPGEVVDELRFKYSRHRVGKERKRIESL